MEHKYIAISLLTVVALIVIVLHIHLELSNEGFSSKREKAQKIFDWFSVAKDPKYVDFKKDLNEQSNIVEYEDVLKLYRNRNLTVESIEKII